MNFPEDSFRKHTICSDSNTKIPVGTVFCVGRNYRKHIEELNNKDLGEPLIFTKPPGAVSQGREEIPLPKNLGAIHHEVELALVIGKSGRNIPQEHAHQYIAGAAVALDLTLRDVQSKAKKNGTPWAIAKGFDFSCPISQVYHETSLETLANTDLFLEKNGSILQNGNTSRMIFSIDYLIAYLSEFFTLSPGDIILTGTPEGVGPVNPGDKITFGSSFSEKVSVRFV